MIAALADAAPDGRDAADACPYSTSLCGPPYWCCGPGGAVRGVAALVVVDEAHHERDGHVGEQQPRADQPDAADAGVDVPRVDRQPGDGDPAQHLYAQVTYDDGEQIEGDLAYCDRSLILQQVEHGIAVRMAVMAMILSPRK